MGEKTFHGTSQWNTVAGPLPPSLGDLTALRVLNLAGNMLNGTFPWQWSALVNLEQLILSQNAISGDAYAHAVSLAAWGQWLPFPELRFVELCFTGFSCCSSALALPPLQGACPSTWPTSPASSAHSQIALCRDQPGPVADTHLPTCSAGTFSLTTTCLAAPCPWTGAMALPGGSLMSVTIQASILWSPSCTHLELSSTTSASAVALTPSSAAGRYAACCMLHA